MTTMYRRPHYTIHGLGRLVGLAHEVAWTHRGLVLPTIVHMPRGRRSWLSVVWGFCKLVAGAFLAAYVMTY